MNTTAPPSSAPLNQFGESQLTGIATQDIRKSTVHLILTTAFFSGAAMSMAKLSDTSKRSYLNALTDFLAQHFGLSTENASGLIESNARLYKRYVLIEKTYNAGWQSARHWHQQPDTQNDSLKTLLKQYQDLSMSGLNIEGIKKQQAAPVEVEIAAPTAPEPIIETPATRWKAKLALITFIALIGAIAYVALYTNLFPTLQPALKSTLESMQEQLSALPLEEWLDKARALIPE